MSRVRTEEARTWRPRFRRSLLYWREALSHPVVGRQIASDYDHVLVDEYQDVNTLQVDVLKLLTNQGQCLTVVGDDAQAIYSFRASSPDHILNFNSDFRKRQRWRSLRTTDLLSPSSM